MNDFTIHTKSDGLNDKADIQISVSDLAGLPPKLRDRADATGAATWKLKPIDPANVWATSYEAVDSVGKIARIACQRLPSGSRVRFLCRVYANLGRDGEATIIFGRDDLAPADLVQTTQSAANLVGSFRVNEERPRD